MKNNNVVYPKMTHEQAVALWNSLTPAQKFQFKDMMEKLQRGELMLSNVNVDDNEIIQNIVLEPKDKPSIPVEPFAKFFPKQEK